MEVEKRRIRRLWVHRNTHTLLPLHASSSDHLSNTVSCWYCDYKISSFNKPLFHFGRRHARFLRVWFSIGVGFALSALLGVTLILLWELARALRLCCGDNKLGKLTSALLFGFPSLLSGLSLSLADAGYICVSTIISVFVHELGHAVAAASEGIQIEYIAIFVAVLFPGALVAFNYELLHTSPHLTALQVYSAGIWHNAVCCGACALALFLLPLVLFPFYGYGHGPMVLDVPPTSPFSGYLAPGDVILSVDSIPVRNAQEWIESETDLSDRRWNIYCLNAKDVVKFNKCGDDWGLTATNGRIVCSCSQDEFCLAPVQEPGLVWVEITYSSPSSQECWLLRKNRLSVSGTSALEQSKCSGTFIFVGDFLSMAHSVQLTSYQPRWGPRFIAYFPMVLEKILIWTFHVSLGLALINSLPVYFLDGESVLDATLCYFTSLGSRMRKKVLRLCLLGGLLLSIVGILQELF